MTAEDCEQCSSSVACPSRWLLSLLGPLPCAAVTAEVGAIHAEYPLTLLERLQLGGLCYQGHGEG